MARIGSIAGVHASIHALVEVPSIAVRPRALGPLQDWDALFDALIFRGTAGVLKGLRCFTPNAPDRLETAQIARATFGTRKVVAFDGKAEVGVRCSRIRLRRLLRSPLRPKLRHFPVIEFALWVRHANWFSSRHSCQIELSLGSEFRLIAA